MIMRFRLLSKDTQGNAMIEFAFVVPILMLLLFGTIELSNYIYATQKVESAGDNIANIIGQQDNISTAQWEKIAQILPQVMRPFQVQDTQYQVILTLMQQDVGDTFSYIMWQKEYGANLGTSKFSYTNGGDKFVNTLPPNAVDGFVFVEGDQVLVVEAYVIYQPLISIPTNISFGLTGGSVYYQSPIARPRSGAFYFNPDDQV